MPKVDPERLLAELDAAPLTPEAMAEFAIVNADLESRIAAGEAMLRRDFQSNRIDDVTFLRILRVYNGLHDVQARFNALAARFTPREYESMRLRIVRGLLDEPASRPGAGLAPATQGDEPGRSESANGDSL